MNRFEIRDILAAHREHFRVLPTLAMNELNGIIDAVNREVEPDVVLKTEGPLPILPVEKVKETPSVVGKRTSKVAKKSKRSKR